MRLISMMVVADFNIGNCIIAVVQATLQVQADAVVNPANSRTAMDGGVARAIKRTGDQTIESEAIRNAPVDIGEAVATSAGRLRVRCVIHAPAMPLPGMILRPCAERMINV